MLGNLLEIVGYPTSKESIKKLFHILCHCFCIFIFPAEKQSISIEMDSGPFPSITKKTFN